jgi:signal transduction histidine kinase
VMLRVSVSRILLVVENEAVDQLPEGGLANGFTPFKRGATSSQRAPSGAGLGLAVVTHLVSALGGKVVTRAQGQHVSIAVQLPRWSGSEVPLD